MRRSLGVLLAVGLLTLRPGSQEAASQPPPLTKEQQKRVMELNRFWQEANEQRQAGRLPEAIAAVDKALAIQREVFREPNQGLVILLGFQARLQEETDDFASARKARKEVLAVQTRLLGATRWEVTDARLALAHLDQLAGLTADQRRQVRDAERLNKESVALYQKGKYAEATGLVQKALTMRQKLLGENHRHTADSMGNLAALYQAQAIHTKAEPLLVQSLAVYKRVLGNKHPGTATGLNNLAVHFKTTGDLVRAEPLYLEALALRQDLLGENDAATAVSLSNLAGLYHERAQFTKADELYRQALKIFDQTVGREHRYYLAGLNNRGELFKAQGQHTQAAAQFKEALKIARQALGEKHPDYATILHNLAGLHQATGDYPAAEEVLQQALEVYRQAVGDKHPDFANGLVKLAALSFAQGRYEQAERHYLQALKISKDALGDRHPDHALAQINLATLYEAQGKFAAAEQLFQGSRQVLQEALGDRHPTYAATLNNLAGLYKARGENAQAEALYRQALEICQQGLGNKHPDTATCLNNLALLYKSLGDYARAEPLYRQILEFRQEALGAEHPHYAVSLNNLAALYQAREEYSRAEPLFQQALRIRQKVLGEKHPEYAVSLQNLALLYKSQGNYGMAAPLYQQALEIRKQALGDQHPDVATTLDNLAVVYDEQGDLGKAEPLYRQAQEVYQKAFGDSHIDHVISLNNLAMLYRTRRDYVRAEAVFRQAIVGLAQSSTDRRPALDQMQPGDFRPLPQAVACLANRAYSLRASLGARPAIADLRSCDHSLVLAQGVLERVRQEVLLHDDSKLHQAEKQADLFPERLALLRRVFDLEGKAEDLAAAFTTAEQASARLFLEQLGRARAAILGGVRPELLRTETDLLVELRSLDDRIGGEQARVLDKRDQELVGRLFADRKQLEARLDKLIQQMEQDFPQYAALKYPRPCTLTEARATLSANEVALLFVAGSRNSAVVVVEGRPAPDDLATGLGIFVLPGADALADLAESLKDTDTLARPSSARAVGQDAYQTLLAPLAKRLRGKDLVIVPGGALGLMPFELLVEDGKFLIENHRIRYAPSLTALHMVRLWGAKRARTERPLWAMGDPVYDASDERLTGGAAVAPASIDRQREIDWREGRTGQTFLRLPHSGAEVRAVAGLLKADGDAARLGLQAQEAAVKAASVRNDLVRYRYLHFATHGILGFDVGRQPALVLSLVGTGAEDGFLHLDEVTQLKLNADLVVLSACRTGQGRLHNGEGVRGLARAFLYAGCRGVVCSLWAVADQETAQLMTAMYGHLQKGQPAAEALQAAKLAMIKAGKPPVYWAPFILIGE